MAARREAPQAVLRSFFMVDWETNIRPLPRYWELLHRRGRDLRTVDLPRVAKAFTEQELTDLQVLFNLSWVGFGGLADAVIDRHALRRGVQTVAPSSMRVSLSLKPEPVGATENPRSTAILR